MTDQRRYLYYQDSATPFTFAKKIRRWLAINPKTREVMTTVDSSLVPAVTLDSPEGQLLEAYRQNNQTVKRRRSQRQGVTCKRTVAYRRGQALGCIGMMRSQIERLESLGFLSNAEYLRLINITARLSSRVSDYIDEGY